ncbi:hypothetical protein [Candidatus Magnetominusculus xianensis]|uniref:Secreted protein n=1 Tax=Candidatus Magnetominusculus xianensis TaxID=1748249 RepID=A0ABR5SKL5_9BACT|nr:hypothetical protein [Candidatus Magnetominusculus xianensis]KWT90512.1 hypothetical protein ASN18_1105 [Candidatus Magnetominusculus xianensis]MBF0404162.1 hypothetical protein [Nitrospirota bacterium]
MTIVKFGFCFVVCLIILTGDLLAQEKGLSDVQNSKYTFIMRAYNKQINSECNAVLKPDIAVIQGTLRADDADAVKASKEIDKKVKHLDDIVKNKTGRLNLQELVRTIEVKNKRGDAGADQSADKPVFMLIQHVEAVFPLDKNIDIDKALTELTQAGLDLRGSAYASMHSTGAYIVVSYRLSNMKELTVKVHDDCRLTAWKNWCSSNAADNMQQVCASAYKDIASALVTRSLRLTSQPVRDKSGSSRAIQLYYPWQDGQFNAIELIGNIKLNLTGNIDMMLSDR